MVFTDLPREELLEAVAREDRRKSAMELFERKPQGSLGERADAAMRRFRQRVQDAWRQARQRIEAARAREAARQQELGYAR
jgi:hypothetical protein